MTSRLTRLKPFGVALPCSFSAWTCKLCCDAGAQLLFYPFLRIPGCFYSSIRLPPAHSSSTTAEVPQSSSSCQIRIWWVFLLLSRAHARVPISPWAGLLSNNVALPCRNTLKHFSLGFHGFPNLIVLVMCNPSCWTAHWSMDTCERSSSEFQNTKSVS